MDMALYKKIIDRLCEKAVFQKCYIIKSICYNSQISKKNKVFTQPVEEYLK